MTDHSKSDVDRLAEALLKLLGQRVAPVRSREGRAHTPGSAAEISETQLRHLKRALESLGLQMAPDNGGEVAAARRLVGYLLNSGTGQGASEQGAPVGASGQSAPLQSVAPLADVVRESEGKGLAPWFEAAPDVGPVDARAHGEFGNAERWHVSMRRALLGDLDKAEGVQLILRLRVLMQGARAHRQGSPSQNRDEGAPRLVDAATGGFQDPLLRRAALPILRLIDELAKEVPKVLKPLLREVGKKFHQSGYKVGDLQDSAGASGWQVKMFQREVGLPVGQLMREFRMAVALRMFRDTPRTVKQVATAIGYSARSLRTLCGDWCGLSPGRLRSRLKLLRPELRSLPEEVFDWFFLERCRRGEVPAETLRPILERLENLYGPVY